MTKGGKKGKRKKKQKIILYNEIKRTTKKYKYKKIIESAKVYNNRNGGGR